MSKKVTQKIDIKQIESPSFLKDLNYKELDVLASDIRHEILNVTSKNGGHLSSNLGDVELTIALCRSFDFLKDKIIFDVGHQCYTYKILTGRKLDTLRKKDGISGFQKIDESLYDCYEAGHSSTSISAANGFAIARDLNKECYDVIAFIGDASIVSGLSFEGLNNVAGSNHKVIIVLNDNDMSISKPTGAMGKVFSRISTAAGYNRAKKAYRRLLFRTKVGKSIYSATRRFKNWLKRKLIPNNLFDTMGFTYIGPVDGHNIKSIEKAIKRAKNATKSVVIHACTMKGKGYKRAEKDISGYWHGVTPFKIESGNPKNLHPGFNSWSHVFSDFTMKIMENKQNAILISPATVKGAGLEDVFAKFSNRTIDVGIAEEHAFVLASSLSLSGFHPIISVYSTFMQRAYDEIAHDLARLNCNATILVERSGLIGADGETHQGIYDVAFLNSVPNVTITMPSSLEEALYLYNESFQNHGPYFIRIPRSFVKNKDDIQPISVDYGNWVKLIDNNANKAIIGVGPSIRELAELIKTNNINIDVYNALYILPIADLVIKGLLKYEQIYIYDPYSISEGLSQIVINKLNSLNYLGKIKVFAINKEYIKQASIDEQLEKCNLLPKQIIEEIK